MPQSPEPSVTPVPGGETHQLTTGAVSKYFPQWSPDASRIFFASGAGPERYQIFRMRAGNHRGSNDLWELTIANGP
jgi:hypothetical protein